MGEASTQLQASITDTLATMEGPEIFWGSDGVALGHDEADIKGYDNFDQLDASAQRLPLAAVRRLPRMRMTSKCITCSVVPCLHLSLLPPSAARQPTQHPSSQLRTIKR